MDPRHLLAGEFLAGAYWKQGDMERFVSESLRRAEVFGASLEGMARLEQDCAEMTNAYARDGHRGLARYMLEQMPSASKGGASLQRAILCGGAGDLDAAFEHLDRVIASHDPAVVHLGVAPQWDSLRGDARFNQRLERMKLPMTNSYGLPQS